MRLNWITGLLAVFVLAAGFNPLSESHACQLTLGNDTYAIGGNQTGGPECSPGPLFFFDQPTSAWVPMVDLNGNSIMARHMKGSATRFGNLLAVIEHVSGTLILRYGVANAQFYDNSNVARGFVAYLNNQHVFPKSLDSVSDNGNQISINVTLGDNRRCSAVADANGVIGGQWGCAAAGAVVGSKLSVDQLPPASQKPAPAKKAAGLAHIPALAAPASHETFIQFFTVFRDAVKQRDRDYIMATLGFNFTWELEATGLVQPTDAPEAIFQKVLNNRGWRSLDEVMKSPSGSAHWERPREVCTPSVMVADTWQHDHLCFQQQDGGEWRVVSYIAGQN